MKYCNTCGSEKVREFSHVYDEWTGKKKYNLVCSNNPCAHGGHDIDYTFDPKRGFWRDLWSPISGKCRRCNFIKYLSDH